MPPEAAIDRFRTDLIACGASLDQRFGICISGGPDSVALLLLAHGAGLDICAATVDHGLRAEARDEARLVAELCADRSIAHQTLVVDDQPTGNISNWARTRRYQMLGHWAQQEAVDWLLTAHQADDQLETMLMRLNRASGLAGLSGIRKQQGQIMRPLLGWRKQELAALVRDCGVVAVDDPSNVDDRFDRARLRKQLAGITWLDPRAAAQSADALASANAALDWTVTMLMETHAQFDAGSLILPGNRMLALPDELQRRMILAAIKAITVDANPRGAALDRLILNLRVGRTATLGGVKCEGGAQWRFSRAASRRTK